MHQHDVISLADADVDGAVAEAADAVRGDTRAGFLARAALGGAGLMGGGALLAALPGVASAQSATDVAILNFALTLEELEAAFYVDALRRAGLRGRELAFARVAGRHEKLHVRALRGVLGRRAIARPRFDFRGATAGRRAFVATAIALEDTGVAAYKGQAPLVRSDAILASALAIHAVEARHAAWIRHIAHVNPAPAARDAPLTRAQVLDVVARTRFIVS